MSYHCISIRTSEKSKAIDRISALLKQKGCITATDNTREEDCLTLKMISNEKHTHIQTSDPFFKNSKLFKSPNDFFIPLSQACGSSAIFIVDCDEEDILQYWIFQNSSCIDQFHSQWSHFPKKEQGGITGNADILANTFHGTNRDQWHTWLCTEDDGKKKLTQLIEMAGLPECTYDDMEYSSQIDHTGTLRFRLPLIGNRHNRYPRRLFPWILLAAPAAYATLRYKASPELVPAPHTPSDYGKLPKIHIFLLDNEFEYFGDYLISIMDNVETFVRLYYRKSDCIHVTVSRTETPVDVAWQTEVSIHFTDGTKVTTTNVSFNPQFPIPYRTIFWKPDIEKIEELLAYHVQRVKEAAATRKPKAYLEENYIEEVSTSIRQDYQSLQQLGFLQLRGEDTYRLTWKGAFKMLYLQWKSSVRES